MYGARLIVFLLTALASLSLVAHTLVDEHGWRRRSRLARDLLFVTSESDALESRVEALRAETKALEASPDAQEHAARDELGWVRAGDWVIQFSEP